MPSVVDWEDLIPRNRVLIFFLVPISRCRDRSSEGPFIPYDDIYLPETCVDSLPIRPCCITNVNKQKKRVVRALHRYEQQELWLQLKT